MAVAAVIMIIKNQRRKAEIAVRARALKKPHPKKRKILTAVAAENRIAL